MKLQGEVKLIMEDTNCVSSWDSFLWFQCSQNESHNLFTKIFLQSHLWTPPHFHSLQLSPEESLIKLSKKNMYVWCWINVFPRWIYRRTFTVRFLSVAIFLAFHIHCPVCMWIYHTFWFQLKQMLQISIKYIIQWWSQMERSVNKQ